jgi:hypothetical protein
MRQSSGVRELKRPVVIRAEDMEIKIGGTAKPGVADYAGCIV